MSENKVKLDTNIESDQKELAKDAKDFLSEIESVAIVSEDDFKFYSSMLQEVKEQLKAIESKEREVAAPLSQALSTLKGWFAPSKKYFKSCERILKKSLADFSLEQKHLKEEAMRKTLEASRSGDFEMANLHATTKVASTEAKGISFRSTWTYQVVDLSLVPKEFLKIDDAAVRKAIRGMKDKPSIPGLDFQEEAVVAVRGKK